MTSASEKLKSWLRIHSKGVLEAYQRYSCTYIKFARAEVSILKADSQGKFGLLYLKLIARLEIKRCFNSLLHVSNTVFSGAFLHYMFDKSKWAGA